MRTIADMEADPGSVMVGSAQKVPGPVTEVNDEEGVAPCLRLPWLWALFFPARPPTAHARGG